jgi:hypothetical protein
MIALIRANYNDLSSWLMLQVDPHPAKPNHFVARQLIHFLQDLPLGDGSQQ